MNVIKNYDSIEAPSEYKRLIPGGYICRITEVEDNPDKEYLKMEYDIADGEFKNYWMDNMERNGWWGGDFIRSYKDRALAFFKQFTVAVELSNNGYKWQWDEKSLKGKLIGLVLGEEEYLKRDGSIGIRLRVSKVVPVNVIKEKGFTVPVKKTLPADMARPVQNPVDDDDLPFDF